MEQTTHTRRFPLNPAAEASTINTLVADLLAMRGVLMVDPDGEGKCVRIHYDLICVDAGELLDCLRRHGYNEALPLLQRVHWSIVGYTERNERENLQAPARPCCSHPDLEGRAAEHTAARHTA